MTVYFEDVNPGQAVPGFQRNTNLENWNRFAAVNDEFMPVHMDHEAAKARGEKDVLGMANLRLSYMQCMLRQWLGDEALVRSISIQHRGVNYKNDTLTAKALVEATRREDGACLVDLDLWVENQRGERIDVGKATVELLSHSDG